MKVNPAIIAATIAGGGIGTAAGFMTKGERAEEAGASNLQQLGQSTIGGLSGGIVGTGIGAGIGGTAVALSNLMRRR